MVYEFEGPSEKEAIDTAAAELGLERDDFDVEILEAQRSGLFKKGTVRVRVHTDEKVEVSPPRTARPPAPAPAPREFAPATAPEGEDEFERNMIAFIEGVIERMGYEGTVTVLYREEAKLGLKIDSADSSILIGKKGKNLDALQLIANIYAGKQGREDTRVVLDSEGYRLRREEALVRLAYNVADRVRGNRASILLEPMNPFDRRLIHTTLADIADIETKSEGEGLYRQVRVSYRGHR